MPVKHTVVRAAIYTAGAVLMAFSLVLIAKTQLGVSPILSVSYCGAEVLHLRFADVTLALHALFVLVQIVLHLNLGWRRRAALDLLQLPFSLAFTRFMALFENILPVFPSGWNEQLPLKLAVLIPAIILSGIGVSMTVSMRIIPTPGDGIVQALSDFSRRDLGLCKNAFDFFCIALSCLIGLGAAGKIIGIGPGTVLAMLGVGRSVAIFNRFCLSRMLLVSGMNHSPYTSIRNGGTS